jgi:hypothetical protein
MREFTTDLPERPTGPYTHSRPLPPYRGILAVDAKDFTGRPAIELEGVSRAVPTLLRTALARAELRMTAGFPPRPATVTSSDSIPRGCRL